MLETLVLRWKQRREELTRRLDEAVRQHNQLHAERAIKQIAKLDARIAVAQAAVSQRAGGRHA